MSLNGTPALVEDKDEMLIIANITTLKMSTRSICLTLYYKI